MPDGPAGTELDFSDEDIIIARYEKELEDGLFEFEIGKEMVRELLNRKKKYTAVLAVNDSSPAEL
jgi:DNA-binding LacI/PurR family transcriptional regulator